MLANSVSIQSRQNYNKWQIWEKSLDAIEIEMCHIT
jgi:hypothetical protein